MHSHKNKREKIINCDRHRGSSFVIATGYELDGSGSIPCRGRDFSLLHSVQTGSGVHPASYTMGTGVFFPGVKAAGV
jgi:hypothetical protein